MNPTRYDIADSNIALLGSDLERRVREHAGQTVPEWTSAGLVPGLEIWRIEQFHLVSWPEERRGTFYDADSYIVLHTYKNPVSDVLSYDLHFWLGENTSQDEAGTAAYKTVELDDHLLGQPVQYREAQGHESERFRSYFPHLLSLSGGIATGFHHVSTLLPLSVRRLYQISTSTHHETTSGTTRTHVAVRQVPLNATSLRQNITGGGDVFVLDLGDRVMQYNARASVGKERFLAADFVQQLVGSRKGQCEATVYDEEGPGADIFLSEFDTDEVPPWTPSLGLAKSRVILFRLSDASGTLACSRVPSPPTRAVLCSTDAFLLDAATSEQPAVYVWIGRNASLAEKRLAVQYAQHYLHERCARGESVEARVPIVRVREDAESEGFLEALGEWAYAS